MAAKKSYTKSTGAVKKRKITTVKTRSFFSKKYLIITALAFGLVGVYMLVSSFALSGPPSSPTAMVCGNTSLLSGPSTAPAGAIVVPAGDNSNLTANYLSNGFSASNKTFWFAPGVHTLGNGQYSQIVPGSGSTYIGAPGAILDGKKINNYAFTQHATNVTIKYLTIQNFGPIGSNNNEGVVNHDAGTGWVIENNTIQNNAGAGVFVGTDNVLRNNCLTNNEQYGFSMYKPMLASGAGPSAITNVVLDSNEISYNNTYDWEAKIEGCGCTGGGKFWDVKGARVVNNWVHHNKSVGLWADTNNIDFLFENNYINDNNDEGIFYEISYNATIRNNTFKRNDIVKGKEFASRGDNFPVSAVYISESGGDARLDSTVSGSTKLLITGNSFEDNWGGVTLWENADRFGNDGSANTSGGYTTKLIANMDDCGNPAAGGKINVEPFFSDCRWKTQNVEVSNNTFTVTPANIGCSNEYCSRQAIMSQYGTYPSWSPYKGFIVADNITLKQNNVFMNNQYQGPWKFMVHDTSQTISYDAWHAAPYSQDNGSSYNGTTPPSSSDTAPPTTSVTSPAEGTTVSGTVSVAAQASDNTGVTKVEFVVDGATVASDTSSPYTYSWNTAAVANGNHTLSTVAYDAAGNTGKSALLSVIVSNVTTPPPTADTTAPVVTIASPANNTKITTRNMYISAGASDNIAVTKMEIYIDGTRKTSALSSSISYNMNMKKLKAGTHTVTVKAYDAAGNVGQSTVLISK